MRRLALALGGCLSLGLAGCQDLNAFFSQQQPRQGTPEVRWVSEPTEILDLQGPAAARVGMPVELTVQVVIGSSSCNRMGEVLLDVDDAARKVIVRATRLTAQAEPPIPCTDDYGWTSKKASFTPAATGTYLVVAQGFKPGGGMPGDRQPQGELSLVVTAE